VGKITSLTKTELAYIAGFLDGDGTVMSLVEKHAEKRFSTALQVLSLSLISRNELLRAAELSDLISHRNLRSKSRKINGIELVKEAISRND